MRYLICLSLLAAGGSLDYEARVGTLFKQLERDVEIVRVETGEASSDRSVPVLMQRRSLWKSKDGSGFFERLNSGHWVEKVPNGGANLFLESVRQPEYVELGRVDGTGTRVRLYEDKCDVMLSGKSFRTFYRGQWER